MSISSTIAKNTVFNFITTASEQVINFGIGVIAARYLGPEDYGLYAFLMWFILFGVYFSNLGLGLMVTRFIAESIGKKLMKNTHDYIRVAIYLRVVAALLVTVIIIIFARYWADIFGYPEGQFLFIILSFGILPYVLTFLLTAIFAGFQKYEFSAYLSLSVNPLRAIAIIVIACTGGGVQEIIIANIGTWVLGVLVGLFLLRRLIPLSILLSIPKMNPEIKRALNYSMIMMGILFINYFLNQRAEMLFMGIFHPGESTGFYNVAFLLGTSAVGIMVMVFSGVLVPAVAKQFGLGEIENIRTIFINSVRYLMMIGLPLAIGGIVLAEPIITVFYGVEYQPVIPILQIMFVPFAILGIADAALGVIFGMNRPSFVFKVGLGLIVLSIGLELWLIPPHGAIGAAIGSSIPRLIAPILYILYALKQCKGTWPWQDMVKIIVAGAIMGGIIFGIHQYIERPIITLITLIPLGVIIMITFLLLFGIIRMDDVEILKSIQRNMPLRVQPISLKFVSVTETLIKWRNGLVGKNQSNHPNF